MKVIKDYMTKYPHTIGHEQPAQKAMEMMREYHIRHLPVLKGGKLYGILSDRDLKLAMNFSTSATVEDICLDEAFSVKADDSLKDAVAEMKERGIGSAIVTDKNRVIGIMTYIDVYRAFLDQSD